MGHALILMSLATFLFLLLKISIFLVQHCSSRRSLKGAPKTEQRIKDKQLRQILNNLFLSLRQE